jgi:hypothetical protein
MSDLLKNLAVWIPRIISVLTILVGLIKAVPAANAVAAAQASGAFASAADTGDLGTGINLTTGGLVATALSFVLPFLVGKVKAWRASRGPRPLEDFAATQFALSGLKVTFTADADIAHINALSDSSFAILKAATDSPVVVPEAK